MGAQPKHLLVNLEYQAQYLQTEALIFNGQFTFLATGKDSTEPLLLHRGWKNSAFRAHLQLAGRLVGWEGGQLN